MKLRSIAVNQFKKFTTPTRLDQIGDGLNVVVGPNEMGKSTLLDALRAALFEKHSSKAQPITALQNDRNEAAPVVELSFELRDGIYTIEKRFIKKPYARLSCPDGRTLEGDAAEDALRSLLGFDEPGKTGAKAETLGMWNVLWVQQGQSFGAFEISTSARSSLHNALESEVGTVLGGRRGRALPLAVEAQMSTLVTSNGKPRGTFKELGDRLEVHQSELRDLRSRRKELEQTFEDLEAAQANLARLAVAERDQSDQRELSEARQRQRQLAELEARIDAASVELELKRRNLAQAEQAANDRRLLKENIESEESTLKESARRLSQSRELEMAARLQCDGLRAQIRTIETDVASTDDLVMRAQGVAAVVDRESRIRELDRRCTKAQEAEARQRNGQQEAATIVVTDKSLAAIRRADKALEAVKSRLSAAATLISFEIAAERRIGIKIDGRPLKAGNSTIRAVESTAIVIPDRGRIIVEPAIEDKDKLIRQHRDAIEKLNDALTAAGVAAANDAEEQYATKQDCLQKAELARQEAELHAPATDDYEAGAQALAAYIEGMRSLREKEKAQLELKRLPSRSEAESELLAAKERATEARGSLKIARAALTGPEEALALHQSKLATTTAQHEETERRIKKLRQALLESVAARSDDHLTASMVDCQREAVKQEQELGALEAQRTDETLPQLDARISRLEKALQDRRDKRANLNETIARLKSRIEVAEAVGLDEAIAQKSWELTLCEDEHQRLDREVMILGLLQKTLRDAESRAKERYLSPVLRRVRPYLQLLFPGAEIQIDEDFRIAGVVREPGYREAFDHLSMGTREQIAVLIRLAFAEMLIEQQHPATVILDDALVYSDDRRMKRMFDILNMAARNVQVLVLTCREQLFEELGGRTLFLTAGNSDDLFSA